MFKELEDLYKGLVNFRNYEVLCESPRISYIECDYTGEYAKGYNAICGYSCCIGDEEVNIFNANINENIKSKFKISCIKNKEINKKIASMGVA